MTQEFEEWFNPLSMTTMVHETAVRSFAERAWQASREQFKARLLSDEIIDIAAEGMFPPLASLGDQDLKKARNYAKAAIEAMAGEI